MIFISNDFVEDEHCQRMFHFTTDVLHKDVLLLMVGEGRDWQKSDIGMQVSEKVCFLQITITTWHTHSLLVEVLLIRIFVLKGTFQLNNKMCVFSIAKLVNFSCRFSCTLNEYFLFYSTKTMWPLVMYCKFICNSIFQVFINFQRFELYQDKLKQLLTQIRQRITLETVRNNYIYIHIFKLRTPTDLRSLYILRTHVSQLVHIAQNLQWSPNYVQWTLTARLTFVMYRIFHSLIRSRVFI